MQMVKVIYIMNKRTEHCIKLYDVVLLETLFLFA